MCCGEISEYLVSWQFTFPSDKSCFIMTIMKIKIITFLLTVLQTQWRLEREVGGRAGREKA